MAQSLDKTSPGADGTDVEQPVLYSWCMHMHKDTTERGKHACKEGRVKSVLCRGIEEGGLLRGRLFLNEVIRDLGRIVFNHWWRWSGHGEMKDRVLHL